MGQLGNMDQEMIKMDIMDKDLLDIEILNDDCLLHIFRYLPLKDKLNIPAGLYTYFNCIILKFSKQ